MKSFSPAVCTVVAQVQPIPVLPFTIATWDTLLSGGVIGVAWATI